MLKAILFPLVGDSSLKNDFKRCNGRVKKSPTKSKQCIAISFLVHDTSLSSIQYTSCSGENTTHSTYSQTHILSVCHSRRDAVRVLRARCHTAVSCIPIHFSSLSLASLLAFALCDWLCATLGFSLRSFSRSIGLPIASQLFLCVWTYVFCRFIQPSADLRSPFLLTPTKSVDGIKSSIRSHSSSPSVRVRLHCSSRVMLPFKWRTKLHTQ